MTSNDAIEQGFIPYPYTFPAIKFQVECNELNCEYCDEEDCNLPEEEHFIIPDTRQMED
jgi:hypothetical protein